MPKVLVEGLEGIIFTSRQIFALPPKDQRAWRFLGPRDQLGDAGTHLVSSEIFLQVPQPGHWADRNKSAQLCR